ncbi:MAG: hypothetical protein LBJ63_07530 [Prevotellaceae bacterium]|jgi:hypothetical protein|nr:hypothetical protein [Prevotellaceae bacterium]
MKKIRNIITGLVCGLGLFAATMSTTIMAAEPLTAKISSCITVCGSEICSPGFYNYDILVAMEGYLNWLLC